MIVWVILILIMGLLMLFFPGKMSENQEWIKQTGLAITLICIGICIRMEALRRRGSREKFEARIKELEREIEALKGKGDSEGSEEENKQS